MADRHGWEDSSEFMDKTSVFKACILSPEQMWSTGVHNIEPVGLEGKKKISLIPFYCLSKGRPPCCILPTILKKTWVTLPQHTGRRLTAAFAVIIPWGNIRACSLCLQVFTLDFGLWLKHRKPVLGPFPSSATAFLDRVGSIFLPLFPNGNINQSLVSLDYVVCLACKLLRE